MENENLREIVKKFFLGWVLASYQESDHNRMVENILTAKQEILDSGMSMNEVQLEMTHDFKTQITLSRFRSTAKSTVKIATDDEIPLSDIYELFAIEYPNYLLSHYVYNEPFVVSSPYLTNEQQFEISWQFVLGVIGEVATTHLREEMVEKEKKAIIKAKEKGFTKDQIIEIILKSDDDLIGFSEFKVLLSNVIRIFQLGGINDEKKIFKYFKVLLVHRFFQLGI